MSNSITAMVSGCLVSWTPVDSNAEALHDELAGIGLEKLAPSARSEAESLKMAMNTLGRMYEKLAPTDGVATHKFVVEPKRNRQDDGFELKDNGRMPKGSENTNKMVITAVVRDGEVSISSVGPRFYELRTDIATARSTLQNCHEKFIADAAAGAVGRSLVGIVKHMHGTCVRLSGGLYYLPDDVVSDWERVKIAYEKFGNCVERTRIVVDEISASMIKRGVVSELTTEATKVLEDLIDNDIREDTMQRRIERAQELREKCTKYEGILQETLQEVRFLLDRADSCAATAQAIKEDDDVFNDCFA